MCMISARDARVSNTGILVAPIPGGRQVTVYGNRVMTSSEGAMILPVPRGTRPIELVDLSAYPDMFEKLNKTRHLMRGGRQMKGSPQIEVVDLGSYRVSIVQEFSHFQNLNRGEFRLTNEILTFLGQHYSENYSFIVCKLNPLMDTKYHPFGYRHERLPDGQLFIPTMHYHLDSSEQVHVDWDHSIYLWNCKQTNAVFHPSTQHFNERDEYILKLQTELGMPACHTLMQIKITDYHANHDLTATPVAAPLAVPLESKDANPERMEDVQALESPLFSADRPPVIQAVDVRTVLPDYVLKGRVVCDGPCSRRIGSTIKNIQYGWHHDPSTDYCTDCFHVMGEPKGFVMFMPIVRK